jgi:hypothetical protein
MVREQMTIHHDGFVINIEQKSGGDENYVSLTLSKVEICLLDHMGTPSVFPSDSAKANNLSAKNDSLWQTNDAL